MGEVYICELCIRAYKPKRIKRGVWELKQFKGYTVDLDLHQFRKLAYGKLPQFIEFASPKGKVLLAQMHEEVTWEYLYSAESYPLSRSKEGTRAEQNRNPLCNPD